MSFVIAVEERYRFGSGEADTNITLASLQEQEQPHCAGKVCVFSRKPASSQEYDRHIDSKLIGIMEGRLDLACRTP